MDKLTQALVQALKEAMTQPDEQPLYKSGKQPGLFASRTGTAGEAAQLAVREGLLEVVHTESKGKTEYAWVRITPRGVQYVQEHESPKAVLEELVNVLKPNREGVPGWLQELRSQVQGLLNRFTDIVERQGRYLDQLSQRAEAALRRITIAVGPAALTGWQLDVLAHLEKRKAVANTGDCQLPELFNLLREKHPGLSIADFHLGLGQLRDRHAIDLVPFSGHLSELAEPEYALLEEAAVYYAVRKA